MGKMHFGYLVTVCARAEKDCLTTFPGVGLKLTWLFDDPREADDSEEERLEKFREVRDEIEVKIWDWLDHPEEELARLKEEREQERKERLEAARREASSLGVFAVAEADRVYVGRHSALPRRPRIALV